jgi:putative transposase
VNLIYIHLESFLTRDKFAVVMPGRFKLLGLPGFFKTLIDLTLNLRRKRYMRPRRYSEKQIIDILKHAQDGMKIIELCRIYGITDTTFYNWRSKFGGMIATPAKRVKQLENKCRMLRDIIIENKPINDVLPKKQQRLPVNQGTVNYQEALAKLAYRQRIAA